jgi:hypothetical protein
MRLPHAEDAVIDIHKLIDYCLNLDPPEGRHKARVFKAALDLAVAEVEELEMALLEAVQSQPAIPTKRNPYGQKYLIDFMMSHGNKQALVRSAWIVRNDEGFPRLVTCYVL